MGIEKGREINRYIKELRLYICVRGKKQDNDLEAKERPSVFYDLFLLPFKLDREESCSAGTRRVTINIHNKLHSLQVNSQIKSRSTLTKELVYQLSQQHTLFR